MSDERLAEVLAAALDALDSGGDDALERFLAAHPGDAEWLRARLSQLQEFGVLHAATAPDAPPTHLGEFVLKERLGSGGMGIVYRAEQPSLQREVALKVIRPEHLFFAGARERFRREVESIAKLQHSNIVRVYESGEAGGVPYFTMERIDGVSLETLLATLRANGSTPPDDRALARILAGFRDARGAPTPLLEPQNRGWVEICFRWTKELADALAYAHELGVLHRDVKPANVMLTWSGKAMLLDFGLATTRTAKRITGTGSLVGSVPYMAPEQLRGDRSQIDERTDVYSLGVTLYELLSLRHPFDERGRDVEATRRRILEGEPPSLRRVAAAVPWDAETVCLTAMERDSSRRYAGAAAFAADLGNVLQYRPITARRPALSLRLRRFAQRHPAATVGALLGFVLVAGGPLGMWWAQVVRTRAVTREQSKTAQALLVVTHQRDEIAGERRVAEARFHTALDSVVDLLTQVGYTQLNNVPNAGQVRRELLQLAERSAQKLLKELPDHPRARFVAGWVDQLLARVLLDRGLHDEARRLLERSCATLQPPPTATAATPVTAAGAEIPADDPDLPEPKRNLVHAMSECLLGAAYGEQERWNEAGEHFSRAIEIHRAALDVCSGDAEWGAKHRRQLAGALLTWGVAKARVLKQVDEGIESVEESCDLLEEVGDGVPDALMLAQALNNLATIHDDLRHLDESKELFARSVETLREVVKKNASNYEARKSLAWALGNLAVPLGKRREYDEAITVLDEAVTLLRSLTADFPERLEIRVQLAGSLMSLAGMHIDCEAFAVAEPFVREALTLQDRELATAAATGQMHADHAFTVGELVSVLRGTGRDHEADEVKQKGLRELDAAIRRYPAARDALAERRQHLEAEE